MGLQPDERWGIEATLTSSSGRSWKVAVLCHSDSTEVPMEYDPDNRQWVAAAVLVLEEEKAK